MLKDILIDNSIIIAPNEIKINLLKLLDESDQLLNINFLTLRECKEKLFAKYDERAVFYLMEYYKMLPENALIVLENIKYATSDHNEQLKFLKKIKKELEKEKLLTYDKHFFKRFYNKNVFIVGYYLDDFLTRLVLKQIPNYKIIKNETLNENIEVYEFNNMSEEITFIAHQIGDLINNGVDINSIKLINASKTYHLEIKRIFKFFNIPVNLKNNDTLYDLEIGKRFIELLYSHSLTESLEIVTTDYDLTHKYPKIYQKIINILNRFSWFDGDLSKIIPLITYRFKTTYLTEEKENSVNTSNLETEHLLNNHLFLIGFNQGEFPIVHKNDDYLDDKTKKLINLETSELLNQKYINLYEDLIKTTKKLTISYKISDGKKKALPSLILNKLQTNIVKENHFDNLISFSEQHDHFLLASKLDYYDNYDLIDSDLSLYYSNYKNFPRLTYKNDFNYLDEATINAYLPNIRLSFSSLNSLYNCSFKYYLEQILKIKKDETNFNLFAGNLFHHVLSKMYDKDFDFEKEYNFFIHTEELSNKEKIWLTRLKIELKKTVEILSEQFKKTNFKKVVLENKFTTSFKGKISYALSGVIDKIAFYSKDGNDYAYLVDYKTGGSFNTKLDFIDHGINLQLPIYAYMLKNNPEYANIFIVGFYYQQVLSTSKDKDYRLQGHTIDDVSLINDINNDLNEGSFIKTISATKKGIGKRGVVFLDSYIDTLVATVEKNIHDAIKIIEEGDFKINPKITKIQSSSCNYCEFRDVCFRKYEDYILLTNEGDDGEDEDELE